MRLTVGRHIVILWHKLRDKKGNFIPNLIGPFLEISLVRQRGMLCICFRIPVTSEWLLLPPLLTEDLRRATLPLIVDIMTCEQMASGNFKRVSTSLPLTTYQHQMHWLRYFLQVETEVFDKMDSLVNTKGWGDEEYKEMFHDLWVEPTVWPTCKHHISLFPQAEAALCSEPQVREDRFSLHWLCESPDSSVVGLSQCVWWYLPQSSENGLHAQFAGT